VAPLPPQSPDRVKSLSYMIGGLLFVLILIEKSLSFSGGSLPKNWNKESFRNIGKGQMRSSPSSTTENNAQFADGEWEDDLAWEDEALQDSFALSPSSKSTKQTPDDGFSIPEVTMPEDQFPKSGKRLQGSPGYLNLFFLKFYGQGKNSQSQLVKVSRQFGGGDPVPFIFHELLKGPSSEEKSKGILNAIPKRLSFDSNYRFEEGILHISFSRELEIGGSPEILKDRLDQICYSLVGNYGIKGVVLYIGNNRLRSIGSDGINLPDVLVRNPRKVIIF
jgi:spore germination protein GerM